MIKEVSAIDISESFPPARNFSTIASIINLSIPLVFAGAAIITLLMLIYGSYRFISAGGDAENLQVVKKIFKWAILGFVLVMISFLLTRLISKILNIDLFL